MQDLLAYNALVREYSGDGNLLLASGRSLDCQFQLIQLVDGKIYLSCTCPLHPDYKAMINDIVLAYDSATIMEHGQMQFATFTDAVATFSGIMVDGKHVGTHNMLLVQAMPIRSDDDPPMYELRFLCHEALIRHGSTGNPMSAHFYLTNLAFEGTRISNVADEGSTVVSFSELPFKIDGESMVLRKVANYDERMAYLRATKRIHITSELVVPIASEASLQSLDEKVHSLCKLFTLARGTAISWLHCDLVTASGVVYLTVLFESNAQDYGIHWLIDPKDAIATGEFIEIAYRMLPKATEQWDVLRVIDAYTDAKAAGNTVNSKALKLAICMEMLKARYLERTGKTNIIPEEVFNGKINEVQTKLKQILKETFTDVFDDGDEASLDNLQLMTNHVRGLNYYPFRRSLSEMCSDVGLSVNSNDRGRVVDIRDRLVHYALFHPRHGSAAQQFEFLHRFVGRFLLATLGYQTQG